MVTPIKQFKKDPNGLGRGDGIYYHRGKGYYSKYSRTRDANRKSTGHNIDPIGLPKATRFPQIADGRIDKYFVVHHKWFERKKKVK